MNHYILVYGDVANGLKFFGPFVSQDTARHWAAEHLGQQPCIVAALELWAAAQWKEVQS